VFGKNGHPKDALQTTPMHRNSRGNVHDRAATGSADQLRRKAKVRETLRLEAALKICPDTVRTRCNSNQWRDNKIARREGLE